MTSGRLVQGYLRVYGDKLKADVSAKRQMLDDHRPGRYGECVTCDVGAQSCGCCGWGDFPCRTTRLLALPYADHPDYREEWRS